VLTVLPPKPVEPNPVLAELPNKPPPVEGADEPNTLPV